jgi:uncharacterized protein (TIGR03067 family)
MPFPKAIIAVTVFAAASVGADPPKVDDAKADAAKLQGTWQVIALTDEMGPAPTKELKEWTFQFNGDKVTNSQSKDLKGRPVDYTLDPAKSPKAIDMNDGGLVIEGIYKVDGDALTLCLVTGSRNGKTAPRPPEFKADKEKKYSLFVLKRVKA